MPAPFYSQAHSCFAPCQDLALLITPFLQISDADASHDFSHIVRVWKNAYTIQRAEGGDLHIILAAVLLHDCVPVQKHTSMRKQASRLAAQKAAQCLKQLGWEESCIQSIIHAIEAHSFSAQIQPQTLEAQIVQDADRLDALGAVGIGRCFCTAGEMGSKLYDLSDPDASGRSLDDRRFALDHFELKLLKLSRNFQTHTGRMMAQHRHQYMKDFLHQFLAEIK